MDLREKMMPDFFKCGCPNCEIYAEFRKAEFGRFVCLNCGADYSGALMEDLRNYQNRNPVE